MREGGRYRELVRESEERACAREREGGSVSHSADRTARRQRERLKLLVER